MANRSMKKENSGPRPGKRREIFHPQPYWLAVRLPRMKKEWPDANAPRNAVVEARAAGAMLAPGALPGPPKMVVMMHARNCPTAHERGGGNSTNNGG